MGDAFNVPSPQRISGTVSSSSSAYFSDIMYVHSMILLCDFKKNSKFRIWEFFEFFTTKVFMFTTKYFLSLNNLKQFREVRRKVCNYVNFPTVIKLNWEKRNQMITKPKESQIQIDAGDDLLLLDDKCSFTQCASVNDDKAFVPHHQSELSTFMLVLSISDCFKNFWRAGKSKWWNNHSMCRPFCIVVTSKFGHVDLSSHLRQSGTYLSHDL